MPQSIWEVRSDSHPPPQYTHDYTDTWAYIGATVKYRPSSGSFEFVPVWNRVTSAWSQLNIPYTMVNYTVKPEWNRAVLTIHPQVRDDITSYRIRLSKQSTPTTYIVDVTVPSTTTSYTLTGLTELTAYQTNVNAEYYLGPPDESTQPDPTPDWSPDNIQKWSTPKNPIPEPPTNLWSPAQANTWIDLAWNPSPNGTAVKYNVYAQVGNNGSPSIRATTTAPTTRVVVGGLLEDTPYVYWVTGVNSSGVEGRPSNLLRWATGHDRIVRSDAVSQEPLYPSQWGGWRRDIGWCDWHVWPGRKVNHQWVYQGYWPGPNNYGPTTANTSQYEQNGRYKGAITYDAAGFRHRLNSRYGYDVGGGFGRNDVAVERVEVRRAYRQREPGNAQYQWVQWWLAWATPYNGEPVLREAHRNGGYNDADHVHVHDTFKAGMYHDYLRLPRHFGHAIVQGWIWNTGTPVNALSMYRGDNEHNGYGTAGYARFSGHGMHDTYRGYTQYFSDWTILITCRWSIQTRDYVGPYQWA